MKYLKYIRYFIIYSFLLISCKPDKTINIHSLIQEMAERESLTRFPSPDFRLLEQSSYNRDSVDPEDSAGWFRNRDFGYFIRTEENQGHKEWVVFEHDGPGVLVRTWTPQKNHSETIVRFYFDGSETPAIEGNLIGLFNSDPNSIAPFPFTSNSFGGPDEYEKNLGSAVCYLPIPFAKSCKITYSKPPGFYIYTYRAYQPDTRVKTFSAEQLQEAKKIIETAGNDLITAKESYPNLKSSIMMEELSAGGKFKKKLPGGNKSIRKITIETETLPDSMFLSKTLISVEFDGKKTVSCPIGLFFGTGYQLNPYHGYHNSVTDSGRLISRWVMPYSEEATITVTNNQEKNIRFSLSVKTGSYKWDDRSMYFYAGWHQENMNIIPPHDWNYVTLKGRGVYAGDVLSVFNPHDVEWYGEGDAKIFADDESFPSMFGTGTEDYYGYSYGGQNRAFFEHPFYAVIRANDYNKNNMENYVQVRTTKGWNVVSRTRSLDGIPFGRKLELNMEVLMLARENVFLDYSVCSFWYGNDNLK